MTQNSTIPVAKAAMREAIKARRAAINPAARRDAAMALTVRGIDFVGPAPNAIIGAFMPIGDEINPLPLCSRLRELGHSIALPRMVGKRAPLEFRLHHPGDAFFTAVWGIREPLPSAPLVLPDVVFVALLAFDKHGFRLGYSGGYYDRTLRQLRQKKPIVSIGLAFDEQSVDAVPHLDYDERLDWVLTPSGPIRCQL